MQDHAPHPYAAAHAPRPKNDPFWERWVPVLVPAGLACLLALAIIATILMADPAAAPRHDQFAGEYGDMFPAQPAPADAPDSQ